MTQPPRISEADMLLIDRYLCGELGSHDRTEFEARRNCEPALAAEFAAQAALGGQLLVTFAPPPVPPPTPAVLEVLRASLAAKAATTATTVAKAGVAKFGATKSGLAKLGVAKSWIAGGLAFLLSAAYLLSPTPHASTAPLGDEVAVYRAFTATGFKPAAKVSDPDELRTLLTAKLGHRIRLPIIPGLDYLGVRGARTQSPLAMALLALDHNHPVLLVLTPVSRTAVAPLISEMTGDPTLYRHNRVLHGIELVEISESPTPLLAAIVDVE